jgi:hypothetical protein
MDHDRGPSQPSDRWDLEDQTRYLLGELDKINAEDAQAQDDRDRRDRTDARLNELEDTVRLLSEAVSDLASTVGRLADERLGPPDDDT